MNERTTPDDTIHSLRLAREVFSPSAVQRERVWTGLAARVPAAAPAARAARAPASRSRAVALLKSGLLVGMGFVLGYWFAETHERPPAPPPAAASAPLAAADAPAPPSPPPVAEPAPPPAAGTPEPAKSAPAEIAGAPRALARPAPGAESGADREPASTAPRAARRTPPASGDASNAGVSSPSAAELALLARAERAIRAGDGALARSFIDDLEARFPKTAWREEREAIVVLAACALGEPGAEREARIFLGRHAGSVYFDRIGTSCRLDANGTTRLGH
jgi:hypothetical protein